jgi:translation elongation factor P/translation initiation factor 5A
VKRIDNDLELLSSYLDGEMSPEEAKNLEEKISYTPELRNKLDELKRLKKLTKSSIKKLPEAPYFETRFFAYIEGQPYRQKIKRWSPVIGITVLTLALMLILKLNPAFIENLFEKQKLNLAGFYKENLKPLLFAADLTSEDIFNFAFYNQLPLDNTNSQFIQLGSDSSGNEYFEINTSGPVTNENNFEKFISTLELDNHQKQQFDSIMSSYADELQTQILVNDKSTVAINQNLWNYRKAIVADIMAFAKASNEEVVQKVMPALFKVQPPVVKQVVHTVKTAKDNDYIFFTPDTLFIDTFEFDSDKFREEMRFAKEEMKKNLKDMNISKEEMQELNVSRLKLDSSLSNLKRAPRVDKNINIFIDSNVCRVHIDKIEIPDIKLPDMESLEAIINEATNQMRSFVFTMPRIELHESKPGKNFHYKIESDDSIKSFNFDVNIPDVDSIIQHQMKNLPHFNYNAPNDSLMKWFNYFRYDDSAFTDNPMRFEFRMKEFEDEMENFKKEMEKLKKEIRKDSMRVKTKKPVEI